jgi:uncharacterized membrane protein YozB (DUF420 family)
MSHAHDVLANTSPLIASGFLPTRGSVMLDFVAVVMLAVTAVLAFSIYQVRYRRNFRLHRNLQLTTAVLLGLSLIAFEVDVRLFTDWRELAKPSPYYESGIVHWSLAIHLCLAIPTPIVWVVVITMALRRFRHGFEQGSFNRFHRISGRIAAAMMFATALTGWTFYYLAFMA